jgi:gas vesicle protein
LNNSRKNSPYPAGIAFYTPVQIIYQTLNLFTMNTNSKIVLGILGAAAAGAIIGLLVAPEKGSDLRTKISNNARDMAGELADWLNAKQKDLKDVKNNLVGSAENLSEEVGNEWKKTKNVLS